jgi:CHAT domain-containing protein
MRGPEDHIGPEELASLPEDLAAMPYEEKDQFLLHISSCQECSEVVEVHRKLRSLHTHDLSSQSSCPSQTVWLEFAEGLHPERSSVLIDHAAHCGDCAVLLREAMSLIQPVQIEAPLEDLESSTKGWQERLASKLALMSNRAPVPTRRERIFEKPLNWPKWAMIPSAVGSIAALVFVGFAVWRSVHPSEAGLLAMAYNQQRTIPLRIPGGNPVSMASGTRGAVNDLPEPVALLKLRLRAQRHLEQTPESAYWHQILGEVSLLEGDALAARRNLEFAQTVDPDLPNLLSDLAAAWFELGDRNGSAESFAESVELYSRELLRPNVKVSIVYYNRALCWERLGAAKNALGDLRSALSSEQSPEWRNAIQQEITRLEATSSTGPQDIRGDTELKSGASKMGNDYLSYEDALQTATEQLIPRWLPDPGVRATLDKIARAGLDHDDRWLHDWLVTEHTFNSADGDRHLATAVKFGSEGDAQESLLESRIAVASYSKAANRPGRLRALLAETYALQRLDRAGDCLNAARELENDSRLRDYAWMRTQLTLEEGSCHFLNGDYNSARKDFDTASASSVITGLNWLHLRALGGIALILEYRGTPVDAWQIDSEALKLCQQTHCPPIREYLLIYTMVRGAGSLDLPHVALELMRTGEQLAAAAGDATSYAFAIENLALAEGQTGNLKESDQEFVKAFDLVLKENSIHSVKLYRAEVQTDQAEVLSSQGKPQTALDMLRQNGTTFLSSDYQRGRLHYFTQMSVALAGTGDLDGALTNALAGVKEAERSLPTLSTATAKEQWQRENAQPYAQLVNVYLRRNQNADAFNAWERFRYLPFQEGSSSLVHADEGSNQRTPLSEQVLVFARINDNYVGWLVGTQPTRVLRTEVIGNRIRVHQLVATFYHLCSDRDSSLKDIRLTGSALYAILMKPFSGTIEPSGHLWLDLDPSLSTVLFAALPISSQKWLGDEYEIEVLPAWWAIHPEVFTDNFSLRPSDRAVIVNGFEKDRDSYSEASRIARFFPRAILLEGGAGEEGDLAASLSAADIFHFSGHASSELGSTRLMFPSKGTLIPALTAEGVSQLHLQQCRIAVLAACNTTSSNPYRKEFAPDLRDALLRSGVHAVIASQWDVDDQSTGELMVAMYNKLRDGNTLARSLQLAQKGIELDQRWRHPFYWASFQLFAN